MMKPLVIRISDDDLRALESDARQQHTTVSAVIRQAVDHYLDQVRTAEITVQLSDQNQERLTQRAKRHGITLPAILRRALRAYLERHRRHQEVSDG
jgi:predicted transcriptional regulator